MNEIKAKLRLRVQPRASKSELIGESEGVWRVRLTAPPVDGAANQACVEFLAECLDLKKNQVRLISGEKSRDKVIEAVGLSDEEAERRLSVRSAKATAGSRTSSASRDPAIGDPEINR